MDRRMLSFSVAALVVVLDRVTKVWIEKTVALWTSIPVIPGFFAIVHARNRGMAFGLFARGDHPLRTVLLIGVAGAVLIFVVVMIWRVPRQRPLQRIAPLALGLILGGAIGNLFDRIARGSVTDFLDIYIGSYHWPAFNLADSAITVGVILLAAEMLWGPAPERKGA